MISEEVCFVGDEVAAVAAVDEDVAKEAVKLIEVEYEELPAVFDLEEAMREDAPQVRPWGPNTLPPSLFEWGDIEKGFDSADLIIENRVTMGNQQHAPLDRMPVLPTGKGTACPSGLRPRPCSGSGTR